MLTQYVSNLSIHIHSSVTSGVCSSSQYLLLLTAFNGMRLFLKQNVPLAVPPHSLQQEIHQLLRSCIDAIL